MSDEEPVGRVEPGADAPTTTVGELLASVDTQTYTLAFYLGLVGWLSYLLVTSLDWKWTDKLFPFMVILPSLGFVLVKLFKLRYPDRYARLLPSTEGSLDEHQSRLRESYEAARSGSGHELRSRAEQLSFAVRLVAWMIALPVLVYVVGLSNSLPLYLLAFGFRFSDAPRYRVVLNALVATVLMYLFFFALMQIPDSAGMLGLPGLVSYFGLG